MTSQSQWHYWWPTILWAAVIWGFSAHTTISASTIHWQDFAVKKLAHVFEYAVFAGLLYRSLVHSVRGNKRHLLWLTGLLVVLYAITDEFHQSFTPGREPHIRDVVIDAVGAFGALWLVDRKSIIKK